MLSRELLRRQSERVAEGLAHRGANHGQLLKRWLAVDEQWRGALVEIDELKRQRNETSRNIGKRKSQGEDAQEEIAAMTRLKAEIEQRERRCKESEAELEALELELPNLPHDTVPRGQDETDNRVEREVGQARTFDFEPRPHWELGTRLGILDFERGAKLAGARFTTYFGLGARLERALAAFMLDLHTTSHGYTEVLPPYMASAECLVGSGQLPKFEEDLFRVSDSHYLIPTAEVPLVNLHRGEILEEDQLPLRYTAWTPCFRAEAGSYGKDVRGLIRQHQFHKVELVQITRPEVSYEALEELTGQAERVLQLLELPYRVVCLSTGDMGFAAAKTYDLEVWLPAQQDYREISSCSNCEDFQTRRANLRYRPEGGGKPRLPHSLNGSGLAVGRTLIAVLENYQEADGSVSLPQALRPYLAGLDRISLPE